MIEGRQEREYSMAVSTSTAVYIVYYACSVCSVPVRVQVANKKIIYKINSRVIKLHMCVVYCVSVQTLLMYKCAHRHSRNTRKKPHPFSLKMKKLESFCMCDLR